MLVNENKIEASGIISRTVATVPNLGDWRANSVSRPEEQRGTNWKWRTGRRVEGPVELTSRLYNRACGGELRLLTQYKVLDDPSTTGPSWTSANPSVGSTVPRSKFSPPLTAHHGSRLTRSWTASPRDRPVRCQSHSHVASKMRILTSQQYKHEGSDNCAIAVSVEIRRGTHEMGRWPSVPGIKFNGR